MNSGGGMGEEVGKGEAGGFRYKVKQSPGSLLLVG